MATQDADYHIASFDGGPLDGRRFHVSELALAVRVSIGMQSFTYFRSTIDSFAFSSANARSASGWVDNVLNIDFNGTSTMTLDWKLEAA